jgi:DNA-directed RNA polymerase subunit L
MSKEKAKAKIKKGTGIDFTIKQVSYTKQDKFTSSQLVLQFTGKDVNYIIANTLRRACYDDIPTYAFEYVNIEHNNSKAFDNDMMTVRLRQLPVYDIDSGLYYLHPRYWQDVNYYEKNREKHENEKLIEVIVNAYNNTNELMTVTTKDVGYYIDGQQVVYPNRNPDEPILIIELLPNQTFKCQLRAHLGVGERDSIWFGCKLAYYEFDEEKPDTVLFTIEGNGQISEYIALVKCCKLINLKLESVAKEVDQRVKSKDIRQERTIFLELVNEDHTIGNLINDALQNHPKIAFSGVSKPDHLVRQIKFKITCTDDIESPIQPFFEVISYLQSLFSHIEKSLEALQ